MVLLRGKVSWALSEGPGRAIRRNGLAASHTLLLGFLVSYMPLARSAFCQPKLAAQRAQLAARWQISSWVQCSNTAIARTHQWRR